MGKPVKKKRRRLKKKYRYIFNGILFLMAFGIFMKVRSIYHHHLEVKEAQAIQARVTDLNPEGREMDTKLETQLKKSWQATDEKKTTALSVAVLYKGNLITYHSKDENLFKTASIVKVSVASQILHESGQNLTKQESDLLSDMIRYSDNDSTTELLSDYLGGYTALDKIFHELKMKNTQIDPNAWGFTTTTAADQIRLLNMLFNKSDYLDTDSKQYIRNLMSNVSSDQDWGVGNLEGSVALKNGWLPDTDGWIVNSMGSVALDKAEEDQYQLVILTKQNKSLNSGIRLIEDIAENTNKIMTTKNKS